MVTALLPTLPTSLLALLPWALSGAALATSIPSSGSTGTAAQDTRAVEQALAAGGLRVDLERGLLAVPATVLVRDELLEYVLVGPRGATHEALLQTTVTPSLINAGVLALGLEPGVNARWIQEGVSQAPERESDMQAEDYSVIPPEGDGLLLYAAWREAEETYLYRVDDLVANLATGRSLRRHRWVFLGSRFHRPAPDEPEVFVADLEQNLINVSFFYQGNTLLTASLPECERQTIWAANPYLVPPRESPLWLVLARDGLDRLPADWEASLPRVGGEADAPDAQGGGDGR